MYEYRDARREDFEHIATFPIDRREAFFMYRHYTGSACQIVSPAKDIM